MSYDEENCLTITEVEPGSIRGDTIRNKLQEEPVPGRSRPSGVHAQTRPDLASQKVREFSMSASPRRSFAGRCSSTTAVARSGEMSVYWGTTSVSSTRGNSERKEDTSIVETAECWETWPKAKRRFVWGGRESECPTAPSAAKTET